MKNLKLFCLILTSIFFGCFENRITFDKENQISKHGQPIKIEYFKHIDRQAFKHDSIPTFTIEDKTEINEALAEIRNANSPEPWKGAGWDRIVLTYNDTIIKINTNKKKIGLGASGSFYDLEKNIINNYTLSLIYKEKEEYFFSNSFGEFTNHKIKLLFESKIKQTR